MLLATIPWYASRRLGHIGSGLKLLVTFECEVEPLQHPHCKRKVSHGREPAR